jgi:rhamnosyltransferase
MSVYAIYVTMNPDPDFYTSLANTADQVDGVIVVDNFSKKDIVAQLRELQHKKNNIQLVFNSENLGIATGLNIGVRQALNLGAEFIFTFDQDSFPQDNMIQSMVKTYREWSPQGKIGLLAPSYFDPGSGHHSQWLGTAQSAYSQTEIVITSGSLVSSAVFKEVGLFDDELFIDYVDHDFCLRLKKAGYEIGIVKDARMAHKMGTTRYHNLKIFSFYSHNHSPSRRYYMARNRVVLYRRHFFTKKWIFRDLIFASKDFSKIILVEDRKWDKIKSIFKGTIDGLLFRLGSLDGAEYKTIKAQKYFVELREEIFDFLPPHAARALDLGCGSGETSGTLRKMGRFDWVCGLESSPQAAQVARKVLDQVIEQDIEKLEFPFAPESFDVILALDILEHLVDPWTVLKNLEKLLKPGGVLVTSLPNVRHYSVVIPLFFMGDWRYQQEGLLDSTHIRFFTRATATRFFEKVGFIKVKEGSTGATGTLGRFFRWISFGYLNGFLDFQILLKMQKPV